MSFPRYETYKETGVEWLGEVPESWHLSKLGFETWVRARLGWKGLKAEEYVEEGFAFLSTPNIKGRTIDFAEVNFISQERYDESPEIKLSEGDVLLVKDGSTLGIANVIRSLPRPATVNSSIAVITPFKNLDSVFLYYLLCGTGMQQLIQQKKGGMGVPHLFQSDIAKFPIPFPGATEQVAIASFLDRETAKIDALIAEQQRLIELLQEKRQTVISHAVTKGLNPNAPMKDSGVEWLGEVPEHWEVIVLDKAASLLQTGPFGSQLGTTDYVEEGIAVINPSNICDESIEPGKGPFITPDKASQLERHWLYQGDLVIARRGEMGRCAVCENSSQPVICGTGSILLRPKELTCPYYLANVIRSDYSRATLSLNSVGSTMENLSAAILGRLRIPMPPKKEQLDITEEIFAVGTRYQELIADALSAVELLTERRSALISASVTGQIDVRGLVPEVAEQ
jgi:type I restriction enzyme S subunit